MDNKSEYKGCDVKTAPPVGDWIMFRISVDKVIIPTKIILKAKAAGYANYNYAFNYNANLESIALWLGRDNGQGDWTQLCDDIKGIKRSYEAQPFKLNLKMSHTQLLVAGNDILLLKVLKPRYLNAPVQFTFFELYGAYI